MEQTIQLGHGGGGRMSAELIDTEIRSRFGAGPLADLPDAATLPRPDAELVFSTDGFVVQPMVFPGGNIGHLAVHGTVNDVAVAGGRPLWLSLALVLEEGLPIAMLRLVLDAVQESAAACEVKIVTGDTKVVSRGQCDGIYINTAGIGERIGTLRLGRDRIEPGDAVLVSGPIGDHGIAVLAAREGIGGAEGPVSDCGPVHRLVQAAATFGDAVRFMRDPTRGGVAAVLNEIVSDQQYGICLDEARIPVAPPTGAIAEMLGLDVLNVACEGRVLAICAADQADAILAAWRLLPEGQGATRFGAVTTDAGRVIMQTLMGGRRLVDVPRGEVLPRIC